MPSRTKSTETQSKIGFRSRKSRRSVPAKLKDLEDEDLDQYRSENRASVRLDLRHAESGPSPRKALLDSPISNSPLRVLSPRNRTDETQGFNSTCCHLEPSRSPRKRLFQDGVINKENGNAQSFSKDDCSPRSPVKQKRVEEIQNESKTSGKKNKCRLSLRKQDGRKYGLIRDQLHTSLPETMLCREKESLFVHKFLEKNLGEETSGSLYISGAPGTGKTVCLTKQLQKVREKLTFKEVWINCMSLNQSTNIYQKIAAEITNEELTCKESEKYLERLFEKGDQKIVLVLDEIDQLESKNQEILYKIFEWPSLPNSRIVLVGIANALDLTDRILPRLQSKTKCRPELLQFAPYTKDQIVEILKDRLKDVSNGLVDSNTVQFCARKVASVAGDMRKALDIMRRSVEIVELETKKQQILETVTNSPTKDGSYKSPVQKKVTLSHVAKVVAEVYGSNLSGSSSSKESLPLQQKVLICTLLLLLKKEKAKEITVSKLHTTYCQVCDKRQLSHVSQEEFTSICQLIEARGIVSIKQAKNLRMAKVSLRLQESHVDHALQDKTLLSSILEGGIPK